MIETSTLNAKEFLFNQKLVIPALILMAHSGQREILERLFGESDAYNLVLQAKRYGDLTKDHFPFDYPLSISKTGELIKQSYRIAGLIMSGQESFFAMKCSLTPEPQPDLKLTKKEKEQLDAFFLTLLECPADILDSPALDFPVNGPASKKRN